MYIKETMQKTQYKQYKTQEIQVYIINTSVHSKQKIQVNAVDVRL